MLKLRPSLSCLDIALAVLMLCAPSNSRRPLRMQTFCYVFKSSLSCRTKMADFENFRSINHNITIILHGPQPTYSVSLRTYCFKENLVLVLLSGKLSKLILIRKEKAQEYPPLTHCYFDGINTDLVILTLLTPCYSDLTNTLLF